MAWKKEGFGTLPNGAEAEMYTLTNAHGVSASFTNLGAIWLRMMVPDQHGVFADVVLGYDCIDDCLTSDPHFGEIVGRNANRIGNATYTLNGITYALVINDNEKNNLHSGPDFFRNRLWDAEIEETELGTSVTFSLFSPDGDQGYPGNATITVCYTLTEDDSVQIDYHMEADEDTVANMTNHAYFNLRGHDSGTILDQMVRIDADRFTIADEVSIPTGELVDVTGTPMDFRTLKPIGKEIDNDYEPLQFAHGYDHNWVLNHKRGELELSAEMIDAVSGRKLEVYTDLPGLQFYTGNFLKGDLGKGGVHYPQRAGCCFETQLYPDAVNKPQFPSTILKAGDAYTTTTIYHFTVTKI